MLMELNLNLTESEHDALLRLVEEHEECRTDAVDNTDPTADEYPQLLAEAETAGSLRHKVEEA
jgi:hypothetical protein